jgi:hypothetical protein
MDLDSEEEYLAEVFEWNVDTDVGDHLSEIKCVTCQNFITFDMAMWMSFCSMECSDKYDEAKERKEK